jgi:Domain of unknown function (DUF3786)
MTINPSSPQPPRRGFDEAYALAYQLAADKLKTITNIDSVCARTGARVESEAGHGVIGLDYLGQRCLVSLPDVEVMATAGNPLTQRDKLVILHYLTTADGSPLEGKPTTFKELPDGMIYYPTFIKRTIKPILDRYAEAGDLLMAAAERLGATKAESGDFSFTINALPRVPVTLTLWVGDEELPAEANILFDASITDYLPTEDITVLCEILAWKLVKMEI